MQRMLTNTTYEIHHDKTYEKKTVHRNQIVPYYPKEEKVHQLVENYVVPDDTDDYYTHYNKQNIARSNAHSGAQHNAISKWPLVETRSGPYTVQRMLTNTTYEIHHDKTYEKKTVHRNQIVPYYPKEEKVHQLVENYVVPDDTDDYYTHYNKQNIARSNAHSGAQHNAISKWPLVETQHTVNHSTTL